MRTSVFVSKVKVTLCRLRLTVLVAKDVILQRSALSSKYECHLQFTVIKSLQLQKVLIIYTMEWNKKLRVKRLGP